MKKYKFLIILIFVGIGIYLVEFSNREMGTPHLDTIDRLSKTYSDQNITLNAKSTLKEFEKLTFSEPLEGMDSQFALALKSFKYLFRYLSKNDEVREYATWLWTPTLDITPSYARGILNNAKKSGVNTIYLSLDSYLDVFVMKEGIEKESKKKKFAKVLEQFITEANERGIAVDAEAGWRNWAEPGNEYKSLALISFVKEFNNTHTEKFRGFQYDVEPYLLDNYDENSEQVLKNFIQLVDKTESYLRPSGLRLGVVVPAFYDEKDRSIAPISYKGSKLSVFKHLLNILDKNEGNSLIVMSYRNFAQGMDGSIEISNNELNTARRGRHGTRIILAQETGDFSPRYITFFGTSQDYFLDQTALLSHAFEHNINFGGLAIHYANSMADLK